MRPAEGTFVNYDICVKVITRAVCFSAEIDISCPDMKWMQTESLNAYHVDGDAGWYKMILNPLYCLYSYFKHLCSSKSMAHFFCQGEESRWRTLNAGFRYCYGCIVAI